MRSFLTVVKADWNNGIVKCFYRILIVFIVSVVFANDFLSSLCSYLEFSGFGEDVSYVECVLGIFRGMKEFIPDGDEIFELPVKFVVLNLFLAYMIGDYIVRDLNGFGIQLLLKSKNKSFWWISKCIWCVTTVVLFYLVALAGIMIVWMTYKTGSGPFDLSQSVDSVILTGSGGQFRLSDIFIMFGVMVLTSVAISLTQMIFALYVSPIMGFVGVLLLYVASGYYMTQWLPGNYLMFYRSAFVVDNGVSSTFGLIIAVIVILADVLVGYIFFKRQDIGL